MANNILDKKVYKSKKALDQANKAKGELGKKKRILKYILTQYVNSFKNELQIQSVLQLGCFLKDLRDNLILKRKTKSINNHDKVSLLIRNIILMIIAPKGEPVYIDVFDEFKDFYSQAKKSELLKMSLAGELVGYGIPISEEDEIELMSFFDGENIFERADRAIEVSKWCLDILADMLEELKKPCHTG